MKLQSLFPATCLTLVVICVSCSKKEVAEETGWFIDPMITVKVDSLLSIMTLEEKIGQLTLFTSDFDITGPIIRENYLEDIKKGRVGAIFNAYGASYTRELQETAVNETRLGIPLLFGYDVIHGFKTIFPIPLGEAATWDTSYIKKAARIAAIEATAEGLHWTFAPMIDVARDPRWGRIAEGAGEDAFLNAVIGVAKIQGFQGEDLSDHFTLLSCAKHFAGYGAAQAGRDYHTTDMSEITLRNVYLPPFKAAVNAGVATFMTAFNDIFSIPCTGNEYLLTKILREEWAFNGFVVTDYTSINEMVPHGYARDVKHAAKLALNAGVDMDMQGSAFYDYLVDLTNEGLVEVKDIDKAVSRIITLKYLLGLFDDPYRYSDEMRERTMVLTDEHLEFARDYTKRSFVLLKNDQNTLPLSKDIGTLAVIGPLADNQSELIGSWSAAGDYRHSVSVLEGIRNKTKGTGTRILYAEGTGINDYSGKGLPEAIKIAHQADAVIMVAGEYALMSGEAASRADIRLPGIQEELIVRLTETGKPLIVILMNGRPLTLENVHQKANAILETWFGGTMTGEAVADVIFGDYNPSGKLPVTFPRHTGQIPLFYNPYNTGRPESDDKYTSKYLEVPNSPLYPFGFGLSYTTFAYSDISLNKNESTFKDTLVASVVVTNTGKRSGEEVVQLYTRDLVGSIIRPVLELKGFRKISLEPGQYMVIDFKITSEDLAFYNAKNEFKAEPGEFQLFIGPHSNELNQVKFILAGE